MKENKNNMLTDINGKESSKRIWANRILWVGVGSYIIHIVLMAINCFSDEKFVISFPKEEWYYLMGAGIAALGLTLGEQQIKKRK